MQLRPVSGPEYDLDFTGKLYPRESLLLVASEGDICSIAYSGGSGWYNTEYVWQDGRWVVVRDSAPWQTDAWNIGSRLF